MLLKCVVFNGAIFFIRIKQDTKIAITTAMQVQKYSEVQGSKYSKLEDDMYDSYSIIAVSTSHFSAKKSK